MAACGAPSDEGDNTEAPIRIGISLPLTGDFSQPGTQAQRGYQVWQKMVNDAGGLLGRQVELVITDDASSQDTVVADYTRLINDEHVDLLLGTFSSLLNYPASAVAERNEMLYVEPAGGAARMFEQGFNYLFFAQPAIGPRQGDVFINWVKTVIEDLPEGETFTAAFPSQDDPFALPVIQTIEDALKAMPNVDVVYDEVYPPDTTNFQPIAAAIAAAQPDLIAQGAVFEDGVGLVRALQQAGYSPDILFQTSAPSNAGQYSDGIGVDNTEGVFYSVSWNEQARTPLNDQFLSEYAAMFNGELPAEDAADAFAAAQVLQAAVVAVGGLDQKALADYLHANAVQTILGELSWDETGAPQSEFMLAQWQSGKVEIVAPKEAATTTNVVYPKPGWSTS